MLHSHAALRHVIQDDEEKKRSFALSLSLSVGGVSLFYQTPCLLVVFVPAPSSPYGGMVRRVRACVRVRVPLHQQSRLLGCYVATNEKKTELTRTAISGETERERASEGLGRAEGEGEREAAVKRAPGPLELVVASLFPAFFSTT